MFDEEKDKKLENENDIGLNDENDPGVNENFDFEHDFSDDPQEHHDDNDNNEQPPLMKKKRGNLWINIIIALFVIFGLYKIWGMFTAKKTVVTQAPSGQVTQSGLQKVTKQPNVPEDKFVTVPASPKATPDKPEPPASATPTPDKAAPIKPEAVKTEPPATSTPDKPTLDKPAAVEHKLQVPVEHEPAAATSTPDMPTPARPAVNIMQDNKLAALNSEVEQLNTKVNTILHNLSSVQQEMKKDEARISTSAQMQLSSDIKDALQALSGYIITVSKNVDNLTKEVKRQSIVLQGLQGEAKKTRSSMALSIDAIIPGRAWLRDANGKLYTVAPGDEIPGYGRVLEINARDGLVKMSFGTLSSS
jgi:SpoU rRNA methylase family enzyme